MAKSTATTVSAYLAELPEARRGAIEAVRDTVLAALDPGFAEVMSFGMIAWVVPLERYPTTYNKQPLMFAALANQQRSMSLYLMSVYGDAAIERWFTRRYERSGKRLDMGKACVRFRTIEDLPLDLISETIAATTADRFIAIYEAARAGR